MLLFTASPYIQTLLTVARSALLQLSLLQSFLLLCILQYIARNITEISQGEITSVITINPAVTVISTCGDVWWSAATPYNTTRNLSRLSATTEQVSAIHVSF